MLRLTKELARTIERGHPWIYADALAGQERAAAGSVVAVADAAGHFLARGIWDPTSPIAIRILTTDESERVDAALVHRRVEHALALRQRVVPDADAVRLLHGEGDRLPGVVCDRYADSLVLRFDADAIRRALGPWVISSLMAQVPEAVRILERRPEERGKASPPTLVQGPEAPEQTRVHEGRVRFVVDLRRSHKTGLYLDQRENHLRVAPLCAGASVLNLFSYTGGFGLHAAASGAARVTNVDQGGPVIEAARRNFVDNDLDPAAHEFVVADALQWASTARRQNRTFDVVIADPPSFAPSERTVARALKSYGSLFESCVALTAPDGLLVTASCSSHVTEAALLGTLARSAAAVGRGLQILEVRGAGPDHPVLASFPEGRYLKVVIAFVSG